MKRRSVRIDDDLWDDVKRKADSINMDVSEVIRLLLRAFVKGTIIIERIVRLVDRDNERDS